MSKLQEHESAQVLARLLSDPMVSGLWCCKVEQDGDTVYVTNPKGDTLAAVVVAVVGADGKEPGELAFALSGPAGTEALSAKQCREEPGGAIDLIRAFCDRAPNR